MLCAAAFTESGHARILALDCSPVAGGVQVGRLVVSEDIPPGEYAGLRVESEEQQTSILVHLPESYEGGVYRDIFLEVRDGENP